jgi:ABC-type proline/glycine betaine transport system permease subunit
MAVMEPQLTVLRLGIGVTQIHLTFPDGLNLRTLEDDPSLKAFLDMIVVVGFAIDSYYAGALRHIEILAPGRMASNSYLVTDLALFLRLPLLNELELAMTNNKASQNDKGRGAGDTDSNRQTTAVIPISCPVLFPWRMPLCAYPPRQPC